MRSSGVWGLAIALAIVVVLFGAVGAGAASAKGLRIVSPDQGALVTGSAVRVQVRGVRSGFSAIVGDRDVSSRFRASHHGRWRTGVLRRGRDLRIGRNSISVGSGRGRARRFVGEDFVVGRRAHGMLSLRRRSGSRSALRVRIAQPKRNRGDKSFSGIEVRLNGRVVRTRDWALGHHIPSSIWPVDRRSFDAMFGSDDGLHHGDNRLTVTAWRRDGRYDRASLRVRVRRVTPLITAGHGARARVGSHLRLHGRASAPGHRTVSLRWEIVQQPRGSRARLRHRRSARPSLVPDEPGRYRMRLVARAKRRPARRHHGPPAFTGAASGGGVAVDQTTVIATPKSSMGVPVQTITSGGGGIRVGDTTYKPDKGAWAQIVVVDAGSGDVVSHESIGQASDVTASAVDQLNSVFGELDNWQIAIVSGGDRPATFAFDTMDPLQLLFYGYLNQIGAAAGNWNSGTDLRDNLDAGKWSYIGNSSNGSGTANFYGLRYGLRAGQWSQSGAITGYLQENLHLNGREPATSYAFATHNVSSIDTNVPGAPAGVNEIRVGSQTYSSNKLKPGESGFHLLVLDEWLTERANQTFVTNRAKNAGATGVDGLAAALHAARKPGNLVVLQSIGHPYGISPEWNWDYPLFSAPKTFGENSGVAVPRAPSTWVYPGTRAPWTLGSAIGMWGGALAHDQIAQLNTAGHHDGYTLIAAAGQMNASAIDQTRPIKPVLSSSVPVSRVQLPQSPDTSVPRPPARIVGTLSRDRQSLWKVDTPSALPGPQGTQLRQIAYQAPTKWPVSGTAADRAANAYIAKQLDLKDTHGNPITNVRDAYYQTNATKWSNNAGDVAGYSYPGSGHGFSASTFDALKTELSAEMKQVSDVWSMIAAWQTIFPKAKTAGSVDLKAIAQAITGQIQQYNAQTGTTSNWAYILGDVMWVAADAASLGGDDELASVTSALSGIVDLSADGSTSASGAPSESPIQAAAGEIGAEVSARFVDTSTNLGVIGSILVGDPAKLKAASEITGGTPTSSSDFQDALTNSAQREFWKALLSTVYEIHIVDPAYDSSPPPATSPWNINCHNKWSNDAAVHVFRVPGYATAWIKRFTQTLPGYPPAEGQLWWGIWHGQAGGYNRYPDQARADLLPQSTANLLFTPLTTGGDSLGMDKTTLFADTRFKQSWWYCEPF